MEGRKISGTQLAALLWAGLLAPAAELFPTLFLPRGGKGAWLAPLAALPLVLLGVWGVERLAGEQGLAQVLADGLGLAGKVVLLLYMVWGELLMALRLRLCAQRLAESGRRDGALWFFLLGMAALVLWMGMGKLDTLARAGQLFLGILLVTGGVVLLLSLSQVRLSRVLPLWTGDGMSALGCALPGAGALGWGLYGGFLTGRTVSERKNWAAWTVGGCLLLTLAQWVILGNLGAALAGRLEVPFFALAKSVGVEGAFQRVEGVVVALWTLADLTMAALLLFAIKEGWAALYPKGKGKWVAAWSVFLAVAVALIWMTEGKTAVLNRRIVPWGNLLFGLALPWLVVLFNKLWGMIKRPDHISSGKKEVKNGRYSCGKESGKRGEKK